MPEKEDLWEVPFGELAKFSLERSSSGFYWATPEGKLINTNKTLRERLGYSEDELKDMYVWDIDPNYSEKDREEFWNKLKEEKTRTFQSNHKTKSGEKYPVETTSHHVKHGGNEYEFAFTKDMTERKKAEEALQESKERFKKLFNASPDATFLVDKNGVFQEFNQAGIDLLGYEKEEIIGKEISEAPFLPSEAKKKIFKNFRKRIQGEKVGPYQIEAETKNGGELFAEVNAALIEEKGEPAGSLGIVRDITEKKKAEEELKEREEKYRTIFESAKDAIFIMKEDKYIDCNKKTLEMFECDRDEIIGHSPFEFSPEKQPDGTDSREKAMEKINSAIEGKPQEFEWVHTTKDGEKFPAKVNLNRYMIDDEIFVMAIVRDITDRKEAKEREEFLHSLLRHDVRNKAQTIQGYLQLLEDLELEEEAIKYIKRAKSGNKKEIDLINKVSLLRKAQEEKISEVRIDKVINKAVEQTKEIAKDKGIEIKFESTEENIKVQGGPLLDQVFTNIIENSIQHSNGSKISIRGINTEEKTTLIIEDDGMGISDEQKEKIFEKGFTTDEERGTGLGMFLVKSLLEIYGGNVEVKDSEWGGARFDVQLQKA